MIYFCIILAIIIVAAFLIPIKVLIDTNIKGDNVYYHCNQKENNNVRLVIKILGIIPVYKYRNDNHKKNKANSQNLTLMEIIDVLKESISKEENKTSDFISKLFKWGKRINFKKFVLVGGFNTEDYVKNAYINASINSIICMFINANQDRFNLNKLYYQVSISDYKYYLTLNTVLSFPLINNIDVFKTIINIIHRFRKKKQEKENHIDDIKQPNYQLNGYIKM